MNNIFTFGYQGVYTRVAGYLDWIESIVWNDGKQTTPAPTTTKRPTIESPLAYRLFVKSKHFFIINLQTRINYVSFSECKEYNDALYETRLVTNGQNQIEQKTLNCPIATSTHIVDGDKAEGKEFPHMVVNEHTKFKKHFANSNHIFRR